MSASHRRTRTDPLTAPIHTRPDPYVVHGHHYTWEQIRAINNLRNAKMDEVRRFTSDPDELMAEWLAATAAALATVNPLPSTC